MSVAREPEVPVYDLVGIGFGPSNLALAVAVQEHNDGVPPGEALRAVFLERQSAFGWHRGMLFEDATMQVSFLKDLVTLRNPASDFSFVSYLHQRGRLVDFVNHKTLFPLRVEFHDYLSWAAERMRHLVAYDAEVTDVLPVHDESGEVVCFDVVARDGVRRARNVVIALGLELSLPPEAVLSARVWHNLDLLSRLAELPAAEPRRFVVVGAGQSAAEVVGHLHERYPSAEVCSVFYRYGYSPADDSSFANRIFDPDAVDLYYHAPADVKRMLFDYHRNTNYSVVDIDLIDDLYRRVYREKVLGRERLRMLNASRVAEVVPREDGVTVTVESMPTGDRETLDADVLVYATGYRPVDAVKLLGTAGPLARRTAEGLIEVDRDYRVATGSGVRAGIYLQGGTEHVHGITSTLLSNVAIRSGEIVRAVAATPRTGAVKPLALVRGA
ncbi:MULTISPECIES: lysine N(6)-hydroxylase/L-ornithine N(5)-oxygenase family protein [Catenuloplanes]|uniref:L-lysine N6-monooxygenase MbtG n=1 Tax=Catenuloplanes niger TaxID=587534 RepID=A0AAE3ZKZ0_9ACTN|nr:lysine N(6)-hydroxylase/L-ornithine N(5)-oxygenase family protein [Catenuloplanes niger]MDR7321859.1 L-ornithine N5-oxygenase [Catenuloplanes niger]